MISLLHGPNTYEVQYAAKQLEQKATEAYGTLGVEKYDGEASEPAQLINILQAVSLFAANKLVLLRDASKNKALWDALAEQLNTLPAGVDLCFIESSPDKRTKTYKLLQKIAHVEEFQYPNEAQASEWLLVQAKNKHVVLSGGVAQKLVRIAGVDQWRLHNELNKLIAYADNKPIDEKAVELLVEPTPEANVFALLDATLNRQPQQLAQLVRAARASEDPYKLIGLLSAQALQLAALVHADGKTPDTIAKDFKVHPYPLKKMQPLARHTSPAEVQMMATVIADLDIDTKSVALEPWLLLERALIKIANR